MGLTGGGQLRQNGHKLHENYKIDIFGLQQWGDMGGHFWVVGGIPTKTPPLGETVESNDFKLKIIESLLTGQDNPMFNNTDMLIPLELL